MDISTHLGKMYEESAVKLRADLQSGDKVAINTDSGVSDVSLSPTPTCIFP